MPAHKKSISLDLVIILLNTLRISFLNKKILINLVFFFKKKKKPLLDGRCESTYTCMLRSCGRDFTDKQAIIDHLKNDHKLSEAEINDNEKKRNYIFNYMCTFDKTSCFKKLDDMHKIAEHICKTHLVNLSSAEKYRLNCLVDFNYTNIFIVSE
jgi:hypothetical protein